MARTATDAEIAQAERDIMERRGQRAIDARKAAEAAANGGARQLSDTSRLQSLDITSGPPEFSAEQVADFVESWRRMYANYDEETAGLLEKRLVAALQGDGHAVPPQPSSERLLELKARQLR